MSIDGSFTHQDKGKSKVLAHYSFNNDGMLSQEAIKILDEGYLGSISKLFLQKVIDLDSEIFDGIFAKDILEAAVNGKLADLLSTAKLFANHSRLSGPHQSDLPEQSTKKAKVNDFHLRPVSASDMVLMDVEQVLLEMAPFEEEMMS